MKHVFSAFSIFALTLVCATFSQDKPGAVQCMGDSIHQMMPGREGMAKGACCMGARQGMGPWHGMPGMREGLMPFQHNFRHHMLFHRGLFIAFLLAIALVNILLTVLVCVDMAALGRFNALWVPVLLLFGIAGTALYALFRIGDQIKEASKSKV
jgi:hypothetical protein